MVALEERLVTIESGGQGLHGLLHLPETPATRAMVFCHPFAEEKKCAHRTMVEAARALAEAGWAALRFDLRGCGDSPGEFGASDLDDWRADLGSAVTWVRRELSPRRAGLLGLRLGATLAAQVAEERDDVDCLVLWEPIVDGGRYIKQNLRRSMIKAMMTCHEGGEDAEGAAWQAHALGEGTVDFDGYRVPERMREQIAATNLLAGPRAFAGPVLVVNLSAGDTVAEPLRRLADAYPAGGAAAVRQEPVWQRIGVIDGTPTTELTVEWLRQIQ
ncbi:MAG: alpha/beta fold hydrolase [Armatimonadota bacterium]